MCPARFFEVCEGDFSIRVSSQKTKHSYTQTHTAQNSKRNQLWFNPTKETPVSVGKSQPLNPPKCEQTPSERWLTARQPSLAVTAHTTLINSSL